MSIGGLNIIESRITIEIAKDKKVSSSLLIDSLNDTKSCSKEIVDEKYSVFGNPDEEQKVMINGFLPEFRQKMIDIGLKYINEKPGEETIEITLNGKKIIFDKVQPFNSEMSWKNAKDRVNILEGRRIPDDQLMQKIINIFEHKGKIIGLNHFKYWTNTSHYELNSKRAYIGNFLFDQKVVLTDKNFYNYFFCIHK